MKRTPILGNVDEHAKGRIVEAQFGKENGQLDSYQQMLKREGRTGCPTIGMLPSGTIRKCFVVFCASVNWRNHSYVFVHFQTGSCSLRLGTGHAVSKRYDGAHESDGSRLDEVGNKGPLENEESYSPRCPFRPTSTVEKPSTNQPQEGPKCDTIDAHIKRESRL
eukprot:GHVS01009560.1.p1 GENE.GHVS01009560.1~~GHVS01009560.1.p1  ORF type:complete len:164 (+),score=14.53 GHVS01009560.1:44-535(+)